VWISLNDHVVCRAPRKLCGDSLRLSQRRRFMSESATGPDLEGAGGDRCLLRLARAVMRFPVWTHHASLRLIGLSLFSHHIQVHISDLLTRLLCASLPVIHFLSRPPPFISSPVHILSTYELLEEGSFRTALNSIDHAAKGLGHRGGSCGFSCCSLRSSTRT